MTDRELQVHVGEGLAEAGARFVDAWHRAEAGTLTPAAPELHVSFETWESFAAVMTPERLALLRHLHRQPARDVRTLAAALRRNEQEVAADVEVLVRAGLIDRDEANLRADYDSVRLETRIAL